MDESRPKKEVLDCKLVLAGALHRAVSSLRAFYVMQIQIVLCSGVIEGVVECV